MSLTTEWSTYDQRNNGKIADYSLEIIDTVGNISGTFKLTRENGFEVMWAPGERNAWPWVQPKSLRFDMYVTDNVHIRFYRAIAESTDLARFIVIHRRIGSRGGFVSTGRPLFVGVILTQGVTYLKKREHMANGKTDKNGIISVIAQDGMVAWKHKTFLSIQTDTRKTIAKWIADALQELPTVNYLISNPLLFQLSWVPDTGTQNWVLNQQVSSLGIREYHRRLGGKRPPKWWEVIHIFCRNFNMRLIPVYGWYFFQQLDDPDATSYLYSKAGDFAGTIDITSGLQTTADKIEAMEPEVYGLEPSLKEVRVEYFTNFNPNLAGGNKWSHAIFTETCYNNLGPVQVSQSAVDTRLRIIGTIEHIPIQTGGFTGEYRPVFWFKIQVGNQYYVRLLTDTNQKFNGSFQAEEWTTTEGRYYVLGNIVVMPDAETRPINTPVFFSTKPIPQALNFEQFSICFGVEAYDIDNNKIFESQMIFDKTTLDDLDVTVIEGDGQIVEKVSQIKQVTHNFYSSKSIDIQIPFGSGPTGSHGRITDDSTPPVDTINWTVPGLGSDQHITQLTKSIMARGFNPQEFMETVIEGGLNPAVKLQICGATWQWWRGSWKHSATEEWWQGSWLRLDRNTSGLQEELEDVFDVLERPGFPSDPLIGPLRISETEVTGITTNTINADTHGIPMPDTTNWSHEMIRDIVTYNQGGNIMRYKFPATIQNEFYFDSATRDFVLSERPFRSDIWNIFRVYGNQ